MTTSIGDIRLCARGDTQKALLAYRGCHRIHAFLAADEPTSLEAQRDLGLSDDHTQGSSEKLRLVKAAEKEIQSLRTLTRLGADRQ